jgi:methylmalonyl-CoA mutase
MSAVPDFTTVDLGAAEPTGGTAAAPADDAQPSGEVWLTPEQIPVKPLYTEDDLEGLDFLHTVPGAPPYLRGPYPTMYTTQPWTIRQYAGFSTAEANQCVLPAQPGGGAEGAVGGVRPRDPPRL